MADFERALSEVKPAFGAVTETLEQYRLNGMVDSGEHFRHLQSTCRNLVEQVTPTSCAAAHCASDECTTLGWYTSDYTNGLVHMEDLLRTVSCHGICHILPVLHYGPAACL